ncbi:MAG: YfhO family protein [Coriobacteriales bacterium]|nr:YfhO family protein [Coriobacteriales bacterium]
MKLEQRIAAFPSFSEIHPYKAFTMVFIVSLPLVFLTFIMAGRGFIWQGDGMTQHYNALMYLGHWLREIVRSVLRGSPEIPFWDFSIGYGSSIIGTMGYYVLGDPLALLSVFVPAKFTEILYHVLDLARFYLAGIAFMLFCKKMEKPALALVPGAFAYALSTWMIIACIRHPFFGNPLVYLPLLLLGFEKLVRRESPVLFIGMTAICAASNFYFFYMHVVALLVFGIVRFVTYYQKKTPKLFFGLVGKALVCGLIGVMIAGAVLLPVLSLYFGASRESGTVAFNPVNTLSYYQSFIAAFATSTYDPQYAILGFSAPVLLGVIVLFAKRREHRPLKVLFLIALVIFLVPFAMNAMNGFAYPTNRWSFIFTLLVVYIFVSMWPEYLQIHKYMIAVAVSMAAYVLLLVWAQRVTVPVITTVLWVVIIASLLFLIQSKIDVAGGRLSAGVLTSLILLLGVCIGVAQNVYYKYSPDWGNDIAAQKGLTRAWTSIRGTTDAYIGKIQQEEASLGRLDQESYTIKNVSINTGAYTTQYFWSLANGDIPDFLFDVGISHIIHSDNYYKLESRAILEELAAVEYYVGPEDRVPYGFELDENISTAKVLVWRNTYKLPLGYTIQSYMSRSQWLELSLAERQDALLQTAVIEDNDVEHVRASLPSSQIETNHSEVPFTYNIEGSYVQIDEHTILVGPKGARLTLTFKGLPQSETYVQINGLNVEPKTKLDLYTDEYEELYSIEQYDALSDAEKTNLEFAASMLGHSPVQRFDLSAQGVGTIQDFYYTTEYNTYRGVITDFLINLGYTADPQETVAIQLLGTGVYSVDSLKVICQTFDNYAKYVSNLTDDILENEVIGTNTVSGDIHLEQDKLLMLSIPYDKGWKAYVDGEETPLLQTDGMYMSLLLTPGDHHIELNYLPQGFTIGCILSICGLLITGCIAFFFSKR